MILASSVYGMLLSVDRGPRGVVYEDVLKLVCGKIYRLSVPYVPGVMRLNPRGENEEHSAGHIWIDIAAIGSGEGRTYGVAIRVEMKGTGETDAGLALRLGQVLCEAATVVRALGEVLP